MRNKAGGGGMESGRQRQLDILKVHLLHVAVEQAANGQRIVWPLLGERRGHRSHEAHEVVAPQLGVQAQAHVADIVFIHQRQRHIEFNVYIALGSGQAEFGQAQMAVVHHDGARQVGHLHATLLA